MATSSEFVAATFLENEDLVVEDLNNLNKAQLRAVTKYLNINLPPATRKDALVQAIATQLRLGDEEGSAGSAAELENFRLQMEFREKAKRKRRKN